jgi:hypothetical protein
MFSVNVTLGLNAAPHQKTRFELSRQALPTLRRKIPTARFERFRGGPVPALAPRNLCIRNIRRVNRPGARYRHAVPQKPAERIAKA